MKVPDQPLRVDQCDEGERLDIYLAGILADQISRSQIKKLIDEGCIRIGERDVSAHYRVKAGDEILFELTEQEDSGSRAENIPLDILYEDQEVIVVNKSAGMVVHPAHGNLNHTLVNALLYHFPAVGQQGDPVRPGIVHRLDKDTSGVMVVAKNERAHAYLARQFKSHTIERIYHTLVRGVVQHDEGICEEPVGRAFLNRKKVVVKPSGGKDAITRFRVIRRFHQASLVEVRPQTGRTHQIRVHMAYLGHPVIGDSLYGVKGWGMERQALHALALGFRHPETRKNLYFETPLPADMAGLLARLERDE